MTGLAILLLAAAAPGPSPCVGAASATPACAAAIASASDPKAKAKLLFQRAYAANERQGYDEALKDLDEAARLDPGNAVLIHERGYTLNALGRYAEALTALDAEVALRPDDADAYVERAFARHRLADFAGEFADRDRAVQLRPGNASALLGRADAALWQGRFDQALADATEARRLAGDDGDTRDNADHLLNEIALWRKRSGNGSPEKACNAAARAGDFGRDGLIGDCTAAFLRAARPADRAEFLTHRSTARLVGRQDQHGSTADAMMAAAIDPGEPNWHSNLGYAFLRVRHSRAAVQEFDRALAAKDSWIAFAGRAEARLNLGDPDGAEADASRSVALRPNEVALLILGDIAHERKDDAAARRFWLEAYRTDPGEHLDAVQRLKSIGIDHPEREAEKK